MRGLELENSVHNQECARELSAISRFTSQLQDGFEPLLIILLPLTFPQGSTTGFKHLLCGGMPRIRIQQVLQCFLAQFEFAAFELLIAVLHQLEGAKGIPKSSRKRIQLELQLRVMLKQLSIVKGDVNIARTDRSVVD